MAKDKFLSKIGNQVFLMEPLGNIAKRNYSILHDKQFNKFYITMTLMHGIIIGIAIGIILAILIFVYI